MLDEICDITLLLYEWKYVLLEMCFNGTISNALQILMSSFDIV